MQPLSVALELPRGGLRVEPLGDLAPPPRVEGIDMKGLGRDRRSPDRVLDLNILPALEVEGAEGAGQVSVRNEGHGHAHQVLPGIRPQHLAVEDEVLGLDPVFQNLDDLDAELEKADGNEDVAMEAASRALRDEDLDVRPPEVADDAKLRVETGGRMLLSLDEQTVG